MREYTKAVKRQLRELNDMAYEAALRKELEGLAQRFAEWQGGKLDCFQLAEEIHKFHDGPARKLFNYYQGHPAGFVEMKIAAAVVEGLIPQDKIPPEIGEIIEGCIAMIEKHRGESDEH